MSNELCLIFDLDGTLVDSELLSAQVLLKLVPQLDDTPELLTDRYRGQKLALIFSDVERRTGVVLQKDFEVCYRAHVAELFEQYLEPIPGVHEMLDVIGHQRCVASSAPLSKVRHALRVTKLDGYFDGKLFSAYQINSWKPAPDLFLHAAKEMGFEPSRCLVIEDSEIGAQAAAAAGIFTFRYVPGASNGKSRFGLQFSSMKELPELVARYAEGTLP